MSPVVGVQVSDTDSSEVWTVAVIEQVPLSTRQSPTLALSASASVSVLTRANTTPVQYDAAGALFHSS